MRKTLFFILFSSVLVSCEDKNKVPDEIIQPKEMQNILWDVIRAQVLSNEIALKDSTINVITETKVLTQKALEIHHIASPLFDKSYLWYTNHPDLMRDLFDSLNVQTQRDGKLEIENKRRPLRIDSLKKIKRLKEVNEKGF